MTDEMTNLVLEHLLHIEIKLDKIDGHLDSVLERLTRIQQMAARIADYMQGR